MYKKGLRKRGGILAYSREKGHILISSYMVGVRPFTSGKKWGEKDIPKIFTIGP
jgi:hypothetical protein